MPQTCKEIIVRTFFINATGKGLSIHAQIPRALTLTTSRSPLYGALRALFSRGSGKNFDSGHVYGRMSGFMT